MNDQAKSSLLLNDSGSLKTIQNGLVFFLLPRAPSIGLFYDYAVSPNLPLFRNQNEKFEAHSFNKL